MKTMQEMYYASVLPEGLSDEESPQEQWRVKPLRYTIR